MSQLGLEFFFRGLEGLFFLILSLTLPTTSFYFANIGKGPNRSLRFSLDGFIGYFVLEI